jgi:hypothetical protein
MSVRVARGRLPEGRTPTATAQTPAVRRTAPYAGATDIGSDWHREEHRQLREHQPAIADESTINDSSTCRSVVDMATIPRGSSIDSMSTALPKSHHGSKCASSVQRTPSSNGSCADKD